MPNQTDSFIKGSNNIITMTLTEDGSPIGSSPTQIDIDFLDVLTGAVILNITRSPTGTGITFSGGVLEIEPGLMGEPLTELVAGELYRIIITIITASEVQGVIYGGDDSDAKQFFLVSDPSP